jgi:hypothetical protein
MSTRVWTPIKRKIPRINTHTEVYETEKMEDVYEEQMDDVKAQEIIAEINDPELIKMFNEYEKEFKNIKKKKRTRKSTGSNGSGEAL